MFICSVSYWVVRFSGRGSLWRYSFFCLVWFVLRMCCWHFAVKAAEKRRNLRNSFLRRTCCWHWQNAHFLSFQKTAGITRRLNMCFPHTLLFHTFFHFASFRSKNKRREIRSWPWTYHSCEKRKTGQQFCHYYTTRTISQLTDFQPAHIFSLFCYFSRSDISRQAVMHLDYFGTQAVLPSVQAPKWASHLDFGRQRFLWTPRDINLSTKR